MDARQSAAPPETAAQAIERVLRAERDADASVGQAREQARVLHETAREEALSIVNGSMERIARWQHAHAAALDQRLRALRATAGTSASSQPQLADSTLAAVVDQVAALLTTADEDANHDGAS